MTAGCAASTAAAPISAPVPGASTTVAPSGHQIVLRFDDGAVPATLADSTAAREFAALLPLTVNLRDPMGQAKSGLLPTTIDPSGAQLVTDPDLGGIYYVPGDDQLAIFYDDLGQQVPAPGLIQLGAVAESALAPVLAAGNRSTVIIDLAGPTPT